MYGSLYENQAILMTIFSIWKTLTPKTNDTAVVICLSNLSLLKRTSVTTD